MTKKSLIVAGFLLFGGGALFSGLLNSCEKAQAANETRYEFPDIFDIRYTPDTLHRCTGWFTDAGSWMGFTVPEQENEIKVNGFCGPFSLDMNRRQWIAASAVEVSKSDGSGLSVDSSCYYPGELRLRLKSPAGDVKERLNFIDDKLALLSVENEGDVPLVFTGKDWGKDVKLRMNENSIMAEHPSGEVFVITFRPDVDLKVTDGNYIATAPKRKNEYIGLSFFFNEKDVAPGIDKALATITNPEPALEKNAERWDGYLKKTLRDDMKPEYDRIAVKAITTLISNYRTARRGLLHDGIIPSHAVGYFVGLWAWDSWRFSAGAAKFDPELAKNNIRAMFDYQQPDGMIIDCIYTDPAENNARDSKPPLVCWAVDEIYKNTADTAFVAEMYPQLLSYYKWWYAKRDHDRNGMCEYGSTDGTLEAAAWESGMDNAIRFDDVKMLKNDGYDDAWSMDQESVDLNAYLAMECKLLKKFAGMLGKKFDGPDYADKVADYFFDRDNGFFFDRRLADRSFVSQPGCEAYTALWTGIARPEQVKAMMPQLQDTTKFSTYIPFPTIAADNPKYNPRGYWRGPIWLDQTYFAINGLRQYGYGDLADKYTEQVFDRLDGLQQKAPIHENYDTHTGARLKAPHFSWAASHLILLYNEYKKK